MCGIVGYVGEKKVQPILLDGLRRLEYRGYDSSGIALIEADGLQIYKRSGKLQVLEQIVADNLSKATIGLGHTRWATHGEPNDTNAHPHTDTHGKIAVIHNGIIENHLELKKELQEKGHTFVSDTDTEVIAHLISELYKGDLPEAMRQGLQRVKGAYALAVISTDSPRQIVAAKTSSPLVIGVGEGENFLASDVPALLSHTREVLYLNDGELAVLDDQSVQLMDFDGNVIERATQHINWDIATAQKSGYKHFMIKEIHEQPMAVADALSGRFDLETGDITLDCDIDDEALKKVDQITLLACGTASYAGLVAKYLFQDWLRLPINVEIGSEFRYSKPYLTENTLVVTISQSGETADTLESMRLARQENANLLGIVNVVGSTITRESDGVLYTHAGPEIGVASTKAFTAQLTVLALLGLYLAKLHGTLPQDEIKAALQTMHHAPELLRQLLKKEPEIETLASQFFDVKNFLYLGRDVLYPIAMEGALKLKEISYIHAEGYPAGELKHGPIALIDEQMPVVVLITKNSVYDKVLSNVEEVKARKGIVIAITDEVNEDIERVADHIIEVPATDKVLTPLLFTVPVQLLAYHIAVLRGTDVDQPRNLAKSVTVE